MDLLQVLRTLDPENDDHWTTDGLPRVDAVTKIVGGKVDRDQITDAAPLLNRESMRADPGTKGNQKPEQPAEVADVGSSPAAPPFAKVAQESAKSDPAATFLTSPVDDLVEFEDKDAAELNVLEMPTQVVMRSPALLRKAIAEIDLLYQAKSKERDKLTHELKVLAGKSETASIVLSRIAGKEKSQDGVKQYLEQARKAREEKAARARAFIEAGTTVKDVAKQLQTKSPLDAAMAIRKPVPGSQRPVMVPPSR
jgi:hypothetical protein